MKRLCLAIGISDAPPLDFLPGAANGARAMAAWATAVGYDEVRCLVDDDAPIGIEEIREALVGRPAEPGQAAVRGLLKQDEPIERLLIYFAGHGLARDAEEDLWLISRWEREERAIAVGGLKRKLERFGIAQIVIIADACRSAGTDQKSTDLTADKVLGAGPFDLNLPAVDLFRAAPKHRAAFMIPGETEDDDRCIFSGVLLEALWGHHDAAYSKFRTPRCITSSSLAIFMNAAVPKQAAVYGVTLKPDITPALLEGDDVYLTTVPSNAPALTPWPAAKRVSEMGIEGVRAADGKRGWSTKVAEPPAVGAERSIFGGIFKGLPGGEPDNLAAESAPLPLPLPSLAEIIATDNAKVAETQAARTAQAAHFVEQYDAEDERPTHYETGAGFSIAGARALTVRLGDAAIAQDERDRMWWRIAPPLDEQPGPHWSNWRLALPLPLLVELEDGRWIGAAALPDFVATFTVTPQGASSLVYRVMWGGGSANVTEAAVAALRAGTLAQDAALDYAIQLRQEKFADPILGVIAAYLYDARADTESIRQIAYFHAERGQAIPYDVALLGRLPVTRDANGVLIATVPAVAARTPRTDLERAYGWTTAATPEVLAPVAGAFPWLRQGWAQLDDDDPIALPGLADLAPHLGAAAFTTLDAAGGKRLGEIIFGGGK